MRYKKLLCLLSVIWTAGANSATDQQALERCILLDANTERLECFDVITRNEASGVVTTQNADGNQAIVTDSALEAPSLLIRQWQQTSQKERGSFVISPYRPSYLMPISYNARPNKEPYKLLADKAELDSVEIKYQLSFKAKIWPALLSERGDLWLAYTQQSFWQAYNGNISSPFRETNYEPEFIYSWRSNLHWAGLTGRVVSIGLNHQSNGRSDPLSRSWNRIVASALFDRGTNFAVSLKGWWRIPESDESDDNPDIEEYIGRGEVWTYYRYNKQTFSAMLRNNFRLDDNRGALQFDWTHPIGKSPIQGYVQYFWGYGDGMIDYDHISQRLSFGIMLMNWL